MTPRETIYLPELPRLRGLYAQALGRQAQTVLSRSRRATRLPEVGYEVRDVTVAPAHLTSYQHLLGERAADGLPAGFVHVVGFPLAVAVMARADFPLPLLGMVHTANHITQRRELRVGSTLGVRAWAEGLAAHRLGTQVNLVVEVGDDAGDEPAWRGESTYLARGVRIPGLPEAAESPRDESPNPAPTAVWRLDASVGRRYAQVSGDVNPIHMSALSAKALGFPRAIAHGMYTASRALAEIGPRRGEAFTWTARFAAPVLLPGTVNVSIREDDAGVSYRGWGKKLNFTGTLTPA